MVYKRRSISPLPSDKDTLEELTTLMGRLDYGFADKTDVSSIYVPVKGGHLKLSSRESHYSLLQGEIELTDKATEDFMSYILRQLAYNYYNSYLPSTGQSNCGLFKMKFDLSLNPSEIAEDDDIAEVVVPATISIFPGKLDHLNHHPQIVRCPCGSDVDIKPGTYFFDPKETEELHFIRTVIFDYRKIDKLDERYFAKEGIDVNLHEKALFTAEAAKQNLGCDYDEISPEDDRCFAILNPTPEEYTFAELMEVLGDDFQRPSFRSAEIKMNGRGFRKSFRKAKIFRREDKNVLHVEAYGSSWHGDDDKPYILKYMDLRFGEQPIIYRECEDEESSIKRQDIGVLSQRSTFLANVNKYAHPLRTYKQARLEILRTRLLEKEREKQVRREISTAEDTLLAEFFESYGIPPNADGGAYLQYTRDQCLAMAKDKFN